MAKHKYLDVAELSVDPSVQRSEGRDDRKVDRMAASFNAAALGTVIVSRRSNGRLIVLDGMHRVETCRRAAYRGKINAIVHEGLSPAEEHELFVLYNTSTAVSVLTKFVQRVQYGEVAAVAINRIVTGNGWAVAPGNIDGHIAAVTALENVYTDGAKSVERGEHPGLLNDTLAVISAAWGLDWRGANGVIMKGVGKFLGRYGDIADTKKVVAELELITPYQLRGKAKALTELQGGTQDAAIGRILTNMHNSRKRSNLLPEWTWSR